MSPSSPPQVAVIGCGHWGKNHVKAFAGIRALAAVYDAHAATAQNFATQYNVPALSWAEILANPVIAGVVLATPASTHAAMAQEALRAGKHVLVEKPLALNTADAEKTIAVAASCQRHLMVGHVLRYHPAFQALEQEIESGRIGAIRHIYSHRLSLGKLRAEEDVLWSFAPHDLSMILALAGTEPRKVTKATHSYLQPGVADTGLILMEFPNGIAAHVHVSWTHPFKEQRLVIVGETGMIVFDDTLSGPQKLKLYAHRFDTRTSPPTIEKQEGELLPFAEEEPLANEARHFIACIQNNVTPCTDGHEGLRVLKILEM